MLYLQVKPISGKFKQGSAYENLICHREDSFRMKEKEKQATASSEFAALLKKVRGAELREFMEAFALQNPHLEMHFLLQFADRLTLTGADKYQLLLQRILEIIPLEPESLSQMAAELDGLLKKATDQLAVKNYLDPFYLAVTLIQSVHPLLLRMAKDGNVLHPAINCAFGLLDNILHTDAGPQLKEMIFETAFQQAAIPDYRYSGMEDQWLLLLMSAATDAERQQRILPLLDQLILETGNRRKDPVNERYEEFFLRKKMQLLERLDRGKAARELLLGNLRIKSFRLQLIGEYILKKNYEAAKELIKESRRSDQSKGRLYVNSEWDDLLLQVAQLEKDSRQIRQVALRLFFERLEISYYREVKKTYEPEKWKAEAEKIISRLKAGTHTGLTGIVALAAIYAEEQYWQRLVQLLQKNANLEFAESYFYLLKDKYPEEMVGIYRKALRRYAEQNMGREHYDYMVKTLRKIQSLPTGVETARSLANEFKVTYSQRRNMVKALNKLVF